MKASCAADNSYVRISSGALLYGAIPLVLEGSGLRLVVIHRKGEVKEGASTIRVVSNHGAAVCLGHLTDDGESEARARHSTSHGRPVEAIEDVG